MKTFIKALTIILAMLAFHSCSEESLPETGSLADLTPPTAGFSYAADPVNYQLIMFSNTSGSATDYVWDLGNGQSSTEKNPSTTFEDGTYTVSLTASDKLNQSSSTSQTITIEKPIVDFSPTILEPSFEDNSLPDGSGDGRDSWRNEAGGVIQITSSPVSDGSQAAKLPSAGDRVGQQQITVLANTDYVLSFSYTMKADEGTLTVAILDKMVADVTEATGATIEVVQLTDNSDPSTYVEETIAFNSGANTEVVIYFNNSGSECRIDNFSIE